MERVAEANKLIGPIKIQTNRVATRANGDEYGGCVGCGQTWCDGSCEGIVVYPTYCSVCTRLVSQCSCFGTRCPGCQQYICICRPDGGGSGGGSGSGSSGGSGGNGNPPPPPPEVTHQRTSIAITDATKHSVQKMVQLYGKSQAVCNFGVQEAFYKIFTSSVLHNKKANAMIEYLRSSSAWEKITMSQAQTLANQGWFVVVGYFETTPDLSGHVAVIVPGTESYSGKWGCNVPQIMENGSNRRYASTSLSVGFGSDKKNSIEFFKYK